MRIFAALLFAVFVAGLAAPTYAQQQPEPQPAPLQPQAPAPPLPGSHRIVPGRMLAGIEVGSRLSAVLARFGQPSELRETAVDSVYAFNRFGILVYARGGVVTAVSTSNSLLKISETVGVGYRMEEVLAAFGRGFRDGTVEGFPGMIYDTTGIAFGLDRRGVAVIIVFRPRTAAAISGLLPGAAAVPPPVAGFPNVAGLRAYTSQTNYMSLPGYLRWVVNQTSGTWITYTEAQRIAKEQRAGTR